MTLTLVICSEFLRGEPYCRLHGGSSVPKLSMGYKLRDSITRATYGLLLPWGGYLSTSRWARGIFSHELKLSSQM